MKKLLTLLVVSLLSFAVSAQQLPNANFEDWSGEEFYGHIQPASWNACNVVQFGFKFNFAHQEEGHRGQYSLMVQDQEVGAAGIVEVSPGYFSLGHPWVFIKSLFKVGGASAGTWGGVDWKYRPDTMSVWIKRTGDNTDKEDFYLLYYSWIGDSYGEHYKGKNEKCTECSFTNEESDIRQLMDGNECGTTTMVEQVAEGMWRERKTYGKWTNIRVPIFYNSDKVPTKMNVIFSASNYPNFRANTGLYAGNSLYVDDVVLIYSDKIHKVMLDGKEWKGFNMNSKEEQVCVVEAMPKTIEFYRGEGDLTNARGTTAHFAGRKLGGSELSIVEGELNGKPMEVKVKSGDGKTSRVYKIKFVTK